MVTISISLPESLKSHIDAQVAAGGYADAGEYVRKLLEHAAEQTGKLEDLRRELQIGLDQSARGESTELDIEAIIAEGRTIRANQTAAKP